VEKKAYRRWRCLNCSYVHEGDAPPAFCPVCGEPSESFQPIEEEEVRGEAAASQKRVVIIGAGIAGVSAAESVRKASPSAPVQLISMEKANPYYRLNLTRYLAGEITDDALPIFPESWFDDHSIEFSRGREVDTFSLEEKSLRLDNGRDIGFDRLVMAMGSHPFTPPVPGTHLENVVTLKTIEDAQRILDAVEKGIECVIIGGGILGMETAGALAKRGADVTLLESHEYLMPRQLNREASARMRQHVEKIGITLREKARTKEIMGDYRVREVMLENGDTVPAGLVILATGIRPNTYLARKLGLSVNRGIVVNNYLESSAPEVFAAGDVAEHNGVVYGTWSISQYQGNIAGMNAQGMGLAFGGLPRSNTIKVLGIDLFSIGQFEPEDGSYLVKQYSTDTAFFHFLFHDGKMQGSILLGDTSIGPQVKKAIESVTDFGTHLSKGWETGDIIEYMAESA
jgi:nitrite reductase (NADH) large subunit